MENKILTTKELANFLRLSPQKINKMRKNGEIPYFKIGRKIFFNKDKIDLWIQRREMESMQPKEIYSQKEVKSIGE